jgi:3-deoxy-D-manno-octulosonate 8-phosphate phosphatase (KDO 8-P phosphatase)
MEGVLTDGTVTIDRQGGQSLSFYTPDLLALQEWQQRGGRLAVMARVGLEPAEAWCRAQGFALRGHHGDKAPTMKAVIFENQMTPPDVCFMGAWIGDLPAMIIAGVATAPADADAWAAGAAHLITQAPGGRGAVAELVRLILDQKPVQMDLE